MRIILSILLLSVCYSETENFCDSPSEEDFLSRDIGCSDYNADSFLFYVCNSINNKIIQKDGYDGVPSYSHNYIVPDTTHLNAWAIYLLSLDILDISAGDTELNSLGYTRIERDFNGNTYHILHESTSASDGDYTNGTGIFILNPIPQIDNSFIHVNHPHDDYRTIFVGAKLFQEMGAKWLFIAGASRKAAVDNSNYSSSSECETQCDECSADMARTTCSVFQKFHENMSNNPLSRSISIHGFKTEDKPYSIATILSNGVDSTYTSANKILIPPPNFTYRLKEELLGLNIWNDSNLASIYDSNSVIAYEVVNTFPTILAASDNPQGKWTNSSEGTGDWVHLEIDYCLRKPDSCFGISDDDMYQDSIVTALSSAFTEPYVINIPDDYSTIQSALTAASEGDTVLVQPDTYYENIIWPETNGIKLISAGDSSNTVIDGGGTDRVIYIYELGTEIDTTTLIKGFTIQNGYHPEGGGIRSIGAGLKLESLLIKNNHSQSGAGIFIRDTDVIILNVNVSNNTNNMGYDIPAGAGDGVGICLKDVNGVLKNVLISDNNGLYQTYCRGGGLYIQGGNPSIINTIIIRNSSNEYGGGVYSNSVANFYNVIIADNIALKDGGGLWGGDTLEYTTICNNYAGKRGAGIYNYYHIPSITKSTISNNINETANDESKGGIYYVGDGQENKINTSNILSNNGGVYVNVNEPFQIVDLMNNYWGHLSGPYHPSQNPTGQGDSTNTFVNVTPWLTEPNTDAPPIPPQNLVVTGNGDVSVDMSWDASLIGDLAGYKVYYDTDSSGYPYANSVDVSTNITHTLSSLSAGTTYYVAVTTFDTDGNESWYSNELILNSGCTITTACNYDANASFGDDCTYAVEYYNCDGACITDTDSDTVCDELEVLGCTVESACNYNADATDDGSCTYAEENYDCDGNCTALDECGVCGGDGVDADDDGVCDDVDDCVVEDGASQECGCNTGIAEGACDCEGNGPADGFDCDGESLSLFNGLIPEDFNLHSIYPNPFNPVTNIIYGLPEHVNVQILVYDLSGKQIETLINQFQTPGYHSVNWNADNYPSGVYFVKIVAGNYINTQKLMLVK